ncbi:hypothetical protein DL240_07555 [Lujinxingia litoralis]|uniref:Uncharacterized protein n=1 Tax=Lujinxingia litoralis TaxID=2211119 RepID=A0A328C683_9DELT|nr:hypothetical protein DL240_07555 [Lujinxingia litoralis]
MWALEGAGQRAGEGAAAPWMVRTVAPTLREYCGQRVLRDERGRRITLSERADWPWGMVHALWWSTDVAEALRGQGVRVDSAQRGVEVVEGALAYCYGAEEARICVDSRVEALVYARVERAGERWEFWMEPAAQAARVSRGGQLWARLERATCGEDEG